MIGLVAQYSLSTPVLQSVIGVLSSYSHKQILTKLSRNNNIPCKRLERMFGDIETIVF